MFLEINEKSLMKELYSNFINEDENMRYLIKGVAESIRDNLLEDKDFKKNLHKKIIKKFTDNLYFAFSGELEDYARQLCQEEINKIQKQEKNKVLKQILSKIEVENEII